MSEVPDEIVRLTLAVHAIDYIMAKSYELHGKHCNKVAIAFATGVVLEAYLSDLDLMSLENIVGSYYC